MLNCPASIIRSKAKAFSLYAIRTILAGRGDELLDLVTTNIGYTKALSPVTSLPTTRRFMSLVPSKVYRASASSNALPMR